MPTYIYAPLNSSGIAVAQGPAFTPVAGGTIEEAWPQNAEQWVDITSASPQPEAGWTLLSGVWSPPVAGVVAGGTVIDDAAFFARFTQAETVAVQAADTAIPALGAALVQGLAIGSVDTSSVLTSAWMGGLVSAGALTSNRVAQILDLTQVSPPVSVFNAVLSGGSTSGGAPVVSSGGSVTS